MKLLGSTESKITKDKNVENVPHLEVVEVVVAHCILINNDYLPAGFSNFVDIRPEQTI